MPSSVPPKCLSHGLPTGFEGNCIFRIVIDYLRRIVSAVVKNVYISLLSDIFSGEVDVLGSDVGANLELVFGRVVSLDETVGVCSH